jgi:heat shock protein HtpX
MNGLKTAFLLGLMSAVVLAGGQALGGKNGLIMGFGFAVLMNMASYFFSDKIALSMYQAQPVSESENPHIWRQIGPLTRNLCERMSLPMPKLWVIPEASPNAFATGRNPSHSSVAVTAGLLEMMDQKEIEGVIAHELGHVKNRDILISSVAATLAAAITMLARMAFFFGPRRDDDEDSGGGLFGGILMMILAPIAAMLIQMAISRTREFSADATAAKYAGSPYGLVSALQKLENYSKRIPMDASPATAHMFIIKPFSGSAMLKLFSTHPPTEERIARLRQLV